MKIDKNLKLSVVIPTFNREDILPRCLRALKAQTIPNDIYEIIIVDDGSTDKTPVLIEQLKTELSISLKYIRQENQGPATARNNGIAAAIGDIIWITGDDYIAEPNCLEEHLKWQEKIHPEEETVVLGFATWHPELPVSDIMYWVENGGLQFYYSQLRHGDEISPMHFITCNISFKRSFFEKHGPFNEKYPYAMGEDTDLGIKLSLAGMRFYYNSNAIAYHYHPITEEGNIKRMRILGETIVLQHRIWPGLHSLNFYQLPYQMIIFNIILLIGKHFRIFIDNLSEKPRRFFLNRYFHIQDMLAIQEGIKKGLEIYYQQGLTKPNGEVIIVYSQGNLNSYYRFISQIKADFENKSLVLIGEEELQTEIRLKHPAIDWFLISPAPINFYTRSQLLINDIKTLSCKTVVLTEEGADFNFSTALFFRLIGIKNVYVYNNRGRKKITGKDWLRGSIVLRPTLQLSLWSFIHFFQRWIKLLIDTILIPVTILRILITEIFF